MKPGHQKWKFDQLLRSQQALVAAAQADADDAIEDIASLEATTSGIATQTEQIFNAAGQVATPLVQIIPYSAGLQILWTCTTPGHTLYYRINGGSWTAYSGSITLTIGQNSDAYATAGGLTDSEVSELYDT